MEEVDATESVVEVKVEAGDMIETVETVVTERRVGDLDWNWNKSCHILETILTNINHG